METQHHQSFRKQRRPKGQVSFYTANINHLRNPWVTAWWSMSFPGFGHLILGNYLKGYALVLLEVVFNLSGRINRTIVYSFTGDFELAKQTLDIRWAVPYCALFLYAIWDSYRQTVDLNKFNILAERENSSVLPFSYHAFGLNFLDKRPPWLTAAFSFLSPGLGFLYIHRLTSGFFVLGIWLLVAYLGNLYHCLFFTLTGRFQEAAAIINLDWFLFLPSIFGFALFAAYQLTVEYNRLFEQEQSRFLLDYYRNPAFRLKRSEVEVGVGGVSGGGGH